MSDPLGFKKLDEEERIYAPEELPPEEQGRVRADEGRTYMPPNEPPPAEPVAITGSGAEMAPANLEFVERGGALGDPDAHARDALDTD